MSQQMPERIPGGGIDLSHLAARGQAAQGGAAPQAAASQTAPSGAASGAPGSGQTVDVPSLVLDVTDATFEQIAQLSAVVPVVFDLWAEWCQPCKTLSPVIEKVTREFDGRVLLAKVDVDANPGLAQAFQAQSIPTVVALVGGRPVPLFQGAVPEAQVREFFGQLVQLAEQNGVSGRVNAPDQGDEAQAGPSEPAEPEIPEAHRAAVEAAEHGDYAAAVAEWEAVLAKAPADAEARAALVQMKLLQRLQGRTADEIRSAAAADRGDVEAQMAVADLDVSGGHVEDAFLRLLDLFAESTDADDRAVIRERLLELFEVVGVADPRVAAARGRLANLLY
ncbi:tetratricopeptide repeat protein [Leucobacter tenebrionis]|uniref:tetratricopeptide repeat protein n=1 Tax=Leucobacter tenebrionis TaxID=2873270 RepID=UPI001CA70962|nr:tetratricopeptide repeat protein [Leucobacter tenebrionis]QZY52434.1 tetratricopeptide repeat protein [Leucobacter tenebrionis]